MRWHEKHYEVVIELTGFTRKFECFEEAVEYAEYLFEDSGLEILVVEVDPKAPTAYERRTPIFLYDGRTRGVKCFRE
jgi:hypothetical protein